MVGNAVVVFLSAGHCGTQRLASRLRELHPGIEVEHEPIGALYAPRRYFRRYDDPAAILAVAEVRRHVERLERTSGSYIETGWPLLSVLPLLAQHMPERVRVVHLTRHPVPSALAHLASGAYAGSPRDDPYTRLATLGACDPGVFQAGYASSWEQLSPYERCLFCWTEVHLFGLEFPGRFAAIPFLRIKAEQIFAGERETLEQLTEFAGLPWDERWLHRTDEPADRWHRDPQGDVDPLEVHRHPGTVETARKLGYELADLRLGALEDRYRDKPHAELGRLGRLA